MSTSTPTPSSFTPQATFTPPSLNDALSDPIAALPSLPHGTPTRDVDAVSRSPQPPEPAQEADAYIRRFFEPPNPLSGHDRVRRLFQSMRRSVDTAPAPPAGAITYGATSPEPLSLSPSRAPAPAPAPASELAAANAPRPMTAPAPVVTAEPMMIPSSQPPSQDDSDGEMLEIPPSMPMDVDVLRTSLAARPRPQTPASASDRAPNTDDHVGGSPDDSRGEPELDDTPVVLRPTRRSRAVAAKPLPLPPMVSSLSSSASSQVVVAGADVIGPSSSPSASVELADAPAGPGVRPGQRTLGPARRRTGGAASTAARAAATLLTAAQMAMLLPPVNTSLRLLGVQTVAVYLPASGRKRRSTARS